MADAHTIVVLGGGVGGQVVANELRHVGRRGPTADGPRCRDRCDDDSHPRSLEAGCAAHAAKGRRLRTRAGPGGRRPNRRTDPWHRADEPFCGDGCMLEAGDDLAGVAFGDFFHQPFPEVHVKSIGKAWHLGKVLFEKWWLSPWGPRRRVLKSALAVGSRIYGVPVNL